MPRPARSKARRRQPALAVAAVSLGCPKNLVDTEVMLGLLQQSGFAPVSDPEQADVLLVNTCSFIQPARDEAAQTLAEAARWRRARPSRALICAGCWPQQDAARLHETFPEIDALMGPGDVPRIAAILRSALAGKGPLSPTASPSSYLYDHNTPRLLSTAPWTAYIKIADGCSHRCRFCAIPRLRGRRRSRSPASITAEARSLARLGAREINLVAQDTTAYGRDRGDTDIAHLLAQLAPIRGLRWIRLLYAFPTMITNRLIDVMAREPTICEYLDLPFQHADRRLLQRMGRPGDADTYLRLIDRLRRAMPDIAIRTTFLLGLPGEGEREFHNLLQFIEAAQLDRAGAFCYSPEEGTPAADMPDQVPPEVARRRFHEVMTLQQNISLARNNRWVGRNMDMLVETPGQSPGQWIGRTFRDAPDIDGAVILDAPSHTIEPGDLLPVTITAAEPYDLIAQPTAP